MSAAPGFRPAVPGDAAPLRALARASEAHWGYDEAFLDTFDRVFNVTAEFIAREPVYVLGAAEAFWGLRRDGGRWELEYFYVDGAALGRGLGRRLWEHLLLWCGQNGVPGFHFVTSPQAVGFYEKMGAEPCGCAPSQIDGRPIPRLSFALKKET